MIKGDSEEYELLEYAVEQCYKLNNPNYILTCEIGIREGLGSKRMMDLLTTKNHKTHYHIGIDPYGSLEYPHFDDPKKWNDNRESRTVAIDPGGTGAKYSNTMRDQLKEDFLPYPNFHLMNMTDLKFMDLYKRGLPVYYEGHPCICSEYSCVHFDGPHRTTDVLRQVLFFCDRSHPGTTFCFDDYQVYNMELIQCVCMAFGFEEIKKGKQKIVLRRER